MNTLNIPTLGSTHVRNIPALVVVDSPLPKLGTIRFDDDAFEFVAYDNWGRPFWGGTPHEVRAAFAADRAMICDNARLAGNTLEQECEWVEQDWAAANGYVKAE